MEIEYKQYVIIPKKPKMSPGKIASQVAHATFVALEKQREDLPDKSKSKHALIQEWKDSGMCVIVLECKDQTQLLGIAKYLEQWKIPHHLYIDEGLTEVSMGTATALATGVLQRKYHWMFSKLNTYNPHKFNFYKNG